MDGDCDGICAPYDAIAWVYHGNCARALSLALSSRGSETGVCVLCGKALFPVLAFYAGCDNSTFFLPCGHGVHCGCARSFLSREICRAPVSEAGVESIGSRDKDIDVTVMDSVNLSCMAMRRSRKKESETESRACDSVDVLRTHGDPCCEDAMLQFACFSSATHDRRVCITGPPQGWVSDGNNPDCSADSSGGAQTTETHRRCDDATPTLSRVVSCLYDDTVILPCTMVQKPVCHSVGNRKKQERNQRRLLRAISKVSQECDMDSVQMAAILTERLRNTACGVILSADGMRSRHTNGALSLGMMKDPVGASLMYSCGCPDQSDCRGKLARNVLRSMERLSVLRRTVARGDDPSGGAPVDVWELKDNTLQFVKGVGIIPSFECSHCGGALGRSAIVCRSTGLLQHLHCFVVHVLIGSTMKCEEHAFLHGTPSVDSIVLCAVEP